MNTYRYKYIHSRVLCFCLLDIILKHIETYKYHICNVIIKSSSISTSVVIYQNNKVYYYFFFLFSLTSGYDYPIKIFQWQSFELITKEIFHLVLCFSRSFKIRWLIMLCLIIDLLLKRLFFIFKDLNFSFYRYFFSTAPISGKMSKRKIISR